MGARQFSTEAMAAILAEAALGSDAQTAKRHGVCRRTLQNWRKRLETDEVFSAQFARKKDLLEVNWGDEAVRALGSMIRKLTQLVNEADVEKIHEVAGAVKIVGELEVVRGMLTSGEQPRPSEPSPKAPEHGPAHPGGNGAARPGNGASGRHGLH